MKQYFISLFFILIFNCNIVAASEFSLRGKYEFTFWGFDVYDATLYMDPQCQSLNCDFTLELKYERDFDGADIAQRSIDEIDAQYDLTDQQKVEYLQILSNIFPDVTDGDIIQGKKVQGRAEFYKDNQLLGRIEDPKLSGCFFDIWLSERTSEPQMRQALLGL